MIDTAHNVGRAGTAPAHGSAQRALLAALHAHDVAMLHAAKALADADHGFGGNSLPHDAPPTDWVLAADAGLRRIDRNRLRTVARRDGDSYRISGTKYYISGVDEAGADDQTGGVDRLVRTVQRFDNAAVRDAEVTDFVRPGRRVNNAATGDAESRHAADDTGSIGATHREGSRHHGFIAAGIVLPLIELSPLRDVRHRVRISA